MKLPNAPSSHSRLGFRFLAGLLLIVGILAWVWRTSDDSAGDPTLSPPRISTPSRDANRRPNQEAMTRFLEIEAERESWNDTVWAGELTAQRYEETIIALWNLLRNTPQPLAVIRQFPVGLLSLETASEVEKLDHDVESWTFSPPRRPFDTNAWKSFVQDWQDKGYALIQSEWRQPRFEPPSADRSALSWIDMNLHLQNTSRQERISIEADLKIQWKSPPENPAELAMPETIDVENLRMHRRQGPDFFEFAAGNDLPSEGENAFVDPLILYDLNGDGLSEIIFGTKNQVYWNEGGGRLRLGILIEQLEDYAQAGVIADFNQDGNADYLCAIHEGLLCFEGDGSGRFPNPAVRSLIGVEGLMNPLVLSAGDVDGDEDLDVWLAQYKAPYKHGQMPTPYYDANDGFPSFLLLNDGAGRFHDATETSGLAAKRFRRTYSASLVDLDSDGDLDLFNVSDFAGVDVYLNDGGGAFTDVTDRYVEENRAFGMSHVFGDFNRDGAPDVFVLGMDSAVADRLDHMNLGPGRMPEHQRYRPAMARGNRMFFGAANRMIQAPYSKPVVETGWTWGSAAFDFDNDADLDFYLVNGHKSRQSVKDYDRQFWLHDIYSASSETNIAWDLYFQSAGRRLYGQGQSYGGFEKNRLLMKDEGHGYVEIAPLVGMALEEDCRNIVSEDLDADGKADVILTTSSVWPRARQTFRLYRNVTPVENNWIGIQLFEEGGGVTPVGAVVEISASGTRQRRWFVTGDSYRAQDSTIAHFGIGGAERVDFVEVRWQNGKRKRVEGPAINQYHRMRLNEAR